MMRIVFFFMLLLLWAAGSGMAVDKVSASEIGVYSMEECVEHALKHNAGLMAAEDEVRKAEAAIGMARSGFFPQITAFGSRKTIKGLSTVGPSDSDFDNQTTMTRGLQLSQGLFAGLTVFNGYQRAILAHQYALVELEERRATLAVKVRTLFLERQRAVEEVKIYEAHQQSLEMNLRALEAMYARDLVPYGEVLNTEAELASLRQKLSEARSAVAQLSIELKGLMELPFENEILFASPADSLWTNLDMTIDEIRDYALVNRPVLRLSRLAVAIVEKDEAVILGSFMPRLSLSLGYHHQDVDYVEMGSSLFGTFDRDYTKEYFSGMLSLEWELFHGGKGYYQDRQIKHEISRLKHGVREQETLTYTHVEKAYAALSEALSRARQAEVYLKSAHEHMAMSNARMERNLGTLPELEAARARLQSAESNLIKARIDSQLAMANLHYAMGKPGYELAR